MPTLSCTNSSLVGFTLQRMAKGNRANCRYCGKHRDEVGPISWAGYCAEHGVMVREQANLEMHHHRGPTFLRWRRAMVASVGGVLLDDVNEQG